jgi:hypothetical protein
MWSGPGQNIPSLYRLPVRVMRTVLPPDGRKVFAGNAAEDGGPGNQEGIPHSRSFSSIFV